MDYLLVGLLCAFAVFFCTDAVQITVAVSRALKNHSHKGCRP